MRSSSFRNSSRASRLNAETRLGLPRPSLDSMRTTRQPHHSEVETDYDEDDYYEDEEEMEAEALLSRRHGEAAETTSSSKPKASKRGATDQDIADEYAQQEKQEKRKRRKVHRTITPDDLIKSKGLTVVRNGIAPRFQNAKHSATNKSMAKFSRRLVAAYADWMDDMTGGLTLQEMHWKLRGMSSKTQIKQYLGDMRNKVRDDHVERLLGLEKAQRLLGQLEDYYNEEQQEYNDNDGDDDDEDPERVAEDPSSRAIDNPYAQNTSADSTDAAVAERASVAVTPVNAKPREEEQPKPQQEEEDPLVCRLALQKEHRARKHVLEDSDDDEDEAIFDDVVPASSATKSSASRKHVLDDDSDDDDNDEEEEENEKDNQETESTNDTKRSGEGADETLDSDEASDPDTARQLDEKFESVKALLEGGDSTAASVEDSNVPDVNDEDGKSQPQESLEPEIESMTEAVSADEENEDGDESEAEFN